jgi:lysophospholipase L1-like esterase
MLKSNTLRQSRSEIFLLGLPFIVFLYPAIALLFATSNIPIYFGRYSLLLLLFNTLIIGVYGIFVFGLMTGWSSARCVATVTLGLLSLIVMSNNSLLDFPGIGTATQFTRILAGFTLLIIALRAEKGGKRIVARSGLVLGALFGLTGLFDLSWSVAASVQPTDTSKQIYGTYRTVYDLTKVGNRDVVLVGDSFVWGAHVPLEERVGDVLERRLRASAAQTRVYSLGVIGANLADYIRQIRDLPFEVRAKQVIILFYANDMPPRANLQDTLQQLAVNLGRASITLRMLVDLARIGVTSNVEEYAALLRSHFDEKNATFAARWRQLDQELTEIFELAKSRSQEVPALGLLPVLVDFQKGSFDQPMRRVGELAKRIGFRVVDTMPDFRRDGLKAEAYRVAPNDLHLNERGNRIVANVIYKIVSDTLAECEKLNGSPAC